MNWHAYENEKRKLQNLNLSSQEYERRIQEIVDRLEGRKPKVKKPVETKEEYQAQIREDYYKQVREEYYTQMRQEYYEQMSLFDIEEAKQR